MSSNSKHDFQFWDKFSDFQSLHIDIVSFPFSKIKYRHHCPEADHVLRIHLYCLSSENFKFEISEKIRLDLVPFKICAHLWFIVLVIYISGTVMKNGATFMFTVLIFVEKWESYRIQKWRLMSWREEEEDAGLGLDLKYNMLVSF